MTKMIYVTVRFNSQHRSSRTQKDSYSLTLVKRTKRSAGSWLNYFENTFAPKIYPKYIFVSLTLNLCLINTYCTKQEIHSRIIFTSFIEYAKDSTDFHLV